MATVGVVSERVRMEEKQLLAALGALGLASDPFPPGPRPLPLSPGGAVAPRLLIDRGQNRAASTALLAVYRALGTVVLDAGLAVRGDRLAVAVALSAAGLPRPETRLATSGEAALAALDEFGYPATVLPLSPGGKAIALLDRDTAEAVVEHRDVLGSRYDALALVQAGAPVARWSVLVVDGAAVAVTAKDTLAALPAAARGLAERAAGVLDAAIIAVEIAETANGLAIWDVEAVPEFRQATAIAGQDVATAIAALAWNRLAALSPTMETTILTVTANHRREVTHGVVLTA